MNSTDSSEMPKKTNVVGKRKPKKPRAIPVPRAKPPASLPAKADSAFSGQGALGNTKAEQLLQEKFEFVGEALYRALGGEDDPPVIKSCYTGEAADSGLTAQFQGQSLESHTQTEQPPKATTSVAAARKIRKQQKKEKKKAAAAAAAAEAALSTPKLTAAAQSGLNRGQRRLLKKQDVSTQAKKATNKGKDTLKALKEQGKKARKQARRERSRTKLAIMSQPQNQNAPQHENQNAPQDHNRSSDDSDQALPQGNPGQFYNIPSPPPHWTTSQPNAFNSFSPFTQPWIPQGFNNFDMQNGNNGNWPSSSQNSGQNSIGAFSPNNAPFMPLGFPPMPMFNGMPIPIPFQANSNQRNFSTTDGLNRSAAGDRGQQPKRHMIPTPSPTPQYLAIAHQEPKRLPSPQPIILVMDLNGTLVYRPKRETSRTLSRPHIDSFLSYIFSNFSIMVWSSAKPPNVDTMCTKTFTPDQQRALVARWSRAHLRLSQAQYNANVQVYKHLSWIWDFKHSQLYHPQHALGKRWDATNTILLDDSALKAASEPHNLLQVSEFKGEKTVEDETVLEQVVDYLEEIRRFDNVAACMRKVPFRFDPDWRRDQVDTAAAAQTVADGEYR